MAGGDLADLLNQAAFEPDLWLAILRRMADGFGVPDGALVVKRGASVASMSTEGGSQIVPTLLAAGFPDNVAAGHLVPAAVTPAAVAPFLTVPLPGGHFGTVVQLTEGGSATFAFPAGEDAPIAAPEALVSDNQ